MLSTAIFSTFPHLFPSSVGTMVVCCSNTMLRKYGYYSPKTKGKDIISKATVEKTPSHWILKGNCGAFAFGIFLIDTDQYTL